MAEHEDVLGLRAPELRLAYAALGDTSVREAALVGLPENRWVEANLLLDTGSPAEVAWLMDVDIEVLSLLRDVRRCLRIHKGDPEGLRKCLDGG